MRNAYKDTRSGFYLFDFTTPKGARHRYSLRTKDYPQALRLADIERARILDEEAGLVLPQVTMGQAVDAYLDATARRVRPGTLETQRRALFLLLAQVGASTPIGHVTRPMVEGWMASEGGAGRGAGGCRFLLRNARAFFGFAKKAGWVATIPVPPAGDLLPRVERKNPTYLEPSQVEALIEEAGRPVPCGNGAHRCRTSPLGGMIAVCAFSGLRVSEMIFLDVEDVDLHRGRLAVRSKPSEGHRVKTSMERFVPIAARLKLLLTEHIEKLGRASGFLFATSTGARFLRSNLSTHLRKVARRCGLEKLIGAGEGAWHTLRRSFISNCLLAGVPSHQVARWAGHGLQVLEHHYAGMADAHLKHEGLERAFGGPESPRAPEPEPEPEPESPRASEPAANPKVIDFASFRRHLEAGRAAREGGAS